jgi:hypothetical protein
MDADPLAKGKFAARAAKSAKLPAFCTRRPKFNHESTKERKHE